jgi:hypothetical protein
MDDKWISLFDTPPEKNYLLTAEVCNTVMFSNNKVGFISDKFTIWFPDNVVYAVLAHLQHEGLPKPVDIQATATGSFASSNGVLDIRSGSKSIWVNDMGVIILDISIEPLMALIKETNKESDYCGLM